MKRRTTTLIIFLFLTSYNGSAQIVEDLFNQALSELKEKNYDKAIQLFDEIISKYPNFEELQRVYLNRAGAKALKKDYIEAINDYTLAYSKDSTYAQAIRSRGYTKKISGDKVGALNDYKLAIKIDSTIGDTYLNLAVLLDDMDRHSEACVEYEKALWFGVNKYKEVAKIIYNTCDSNSIEIQKFSYKILIDKSTDKTYGYQENNCIKVGTSPRAQKAYLNLLRDAKGNKVSYERKGSGGFYTSENGMMGLATPDIYEIKYKDEKGKKKKVTLYISFYDYKQPQIPVGFYSVQDFIKK